ncbi:MAG TPA: hypothetical protein VK911_17680 [Vicinamibacterales bacterium]|nr:hypothetical protein [Vicinamibacterales bacterium]
MKVMTRAAVLSGLLAFAGCASMTGDRPVGTTGTTAPTEPTQVQGTEQGRIPVGQEIDVRLQNTLSSGTATTEQRFQATTVVDLRQGETVLVPGGSTVRGFVSDVQPAGRVDRSGRLTLAFDQIVVNGREYPIKGLATQVFESRGIREEAGTVGTGGAVGAIVGGILGGLRGALIGAAVGGGGVIAATEGKDIELPAGTIVRVRMDTPVAIR